MKGTFLFLVTCLLSLFIASCDDQGDPVTTPAAPSNAPTIVSMVPDSGAVGDTITIKGTKFGTTKGSSSITFGTIASVSTGTWSDTLVKTIVPTNAVTSNVTVTVNGNKSNGKSFKILGTVPGVSFANDVLPLFTGATYGCTGCHGGQNNLSLGSYAQVMAGNSNHGPVVIAGNASGSVLVKKLRTATLSFGARMPFGGSQINDTDLQKIVDWINQGALNN